MLNYIWVAMLIIGFTVGIINGKTELVTQAAIESSQKAIELCFELLGIMCLWTGLMKIAEKSGLIKTISKAVKPIMKVVFPDIPSTHPAAGSVVMNLVANFLGLGNAATPLGIKAMIELQKLNGKSNVATNAMSMFLVLNTSCIQLIPATTIAIRKAAGSSNPTEIIVTVWFASICATIGGIISVKIFTKIYGIKRAKTRC